MLEEQMKYYFQDSIVQNWEQFKENAIQSTDTYEECYRKISNVFCNYGHHEMKPWLYFKDIFEDIPKAYRIPLLLELPYQSYNIDLAELVNMIDECLQSETEEEREYRISRNKELLKGKAKKNKIKLYRGIAENYLLPENALSFSLSKEVAESFLEYHNARHNSTFVFVYEMEITIDDESILYYSNERSEEEVFYWSEDITSIPFMMETGMSDDLYLTEDTLPDYEDDYDIIRFPQNDSNK